MTNTAVLIPHPDIETLEKLYSFRNKKEVLDFIAENYFILNTLLEAPAKIRPYFPDSELCLQVDYDPEIIGEVNLLLWILTNLEANDSLERHNQLDYAWWLKASYEVRDKICVILGAL
jgi:hypothetical protein